MKKKIAPPKPKEEVAGEILPNPKRKICNQPNEMIKPAKDDNLCHKNAMRVYYG